MAIRKDYTKAIEEASVVIDGSLFIFYGDGAVSKDFWGKDVYINTPAFEVVRLPQGFNIIPITKKRQVPLDSFNFPSRGRDLITRLAADPTWHGFTIPLSGGKYKEVKVSIEGGLPFFDAAKTDAYHLSQRKKPKKRNREEESEDELPGVSMGFCFSVTNPAEAARIRAEVTAAVRQTLKANGIKHYSEKR